ncbi:MAG: helix-turn-helix transcriptional regulator [Chloroflexota bacterium]
MSARSDIESVLAGQRRRPDWPSERYLVADFAIQVASQFEQLRERQGLSYEDLARKAGTSKAHVIRLLSGTYAGISNRSLAKLAAALGCEIEVQVGPVRPARATARPFRHTFSPS